MYNLNDKPLDKGTANEEDLFDFSFIKYMDKRDIRRFLAISELKKGQNSYEYSKFLMLSNVK